MAVSFLPSKSSPFYLFLYLPATARLFSKLLNRKQLCLVCDFQENNFNIYCFLQFSLIELRNFPMKSCLALLNVFSLVYSEDNIYIF